MVTKKTSKAEDQPVKEESQPKEAPKKATKKEAANQNKDYPDFKGDAKVDYLDINNPDHGNKTYEELQAEAQKKSKS